MRTDFSRVWVEAFAENETSKLVLTMIFTYKISLWYDILVLQLTNRPLASNW